eukprot:TRINITY_DN2649_c0_g1_i2.p1 TRINITY_DN2649_c0_g1~~TRINITY_DN2649_c0_g1_i2.p1  ORF type:complete len:290 (-),score=82.30 TRINITY_DN2649_c0_g1_i2:268-1137(-)
MGCCLQKVLDGMVGDSSWEAHTLQKRIQIDTPRASEVAWTILSEVDNYLEFHSMDRIQLAALETHARNGSKYGAGSTFRVKGEVKVESRKHGTQTRDQTQIFSCVVFEPKSQLTFAIRDPAAKIQSEQAMAQARNTSPVHAQMAQAMHRSGFKSYEGEVYFGYELTDATATSVCVTFRVTVMMVRNKLMDPSLELPKLQLNVDTCAAKIKQACEQKGPEVLGTLPETTQVQGAAGVVEMSKLDLTQVHLNMLPPPHVGADPRRADDVVVDLRGSEQLDEEGEGRCRCCF